MTELLMTAAIWLLTFGFCFGCIVVLLMAFEDEPEREEA